MHNWSISRRLGVFAVVLGGLTACSSSTATSSVATSSTASVATNGSIAPATSAAPSTIVPATTVSVPVTVPSEITLPNLVLPTGVLFAELSQEREDVVQNIYQVRMVNGTADTIDVASVQFVWPGFQTAPPSTKGTKVATLAQVDLPVDFDGAQCSGDGSAASMPSVDGAKATVEFADGTSQSVPVFDVNGLLSKLYLSDCERQRIDMAVSLSFTDWKDVTVDGLPRTQGVLHVQRAASTGTIRILDLSDTVVFTLTAIQRTNPLVVLTPDQTSVDLPVLVTEKGCIDHIFAETKQPFLFRVFIDPGDGVDHGYVLQPDPAVRPHMMQTAIDACHLKATTSTT